MKVQLVHIPGGVSLRDADQTDPEQCRVIGKIYVPSDAWGIERAMNAHDQLVAALKRFTAYGNTFAYRVQDGCPVEQAIDALAAAGVE